MEDVWLGMENEMESLGMVSSQRGVDLEVWM